jgi:exosome complex component RRP46
MMEKQLIVGLLNKTDGSAKFVNGDTVVIASVVGPKTSINDNMGCRVQVTWCSDGDQRDETEGERKRVIQKIVESLVWTTKYPRTIIRIGVTVLRNTGSLLATAVNAVVMALIDSGIMMNGIATAASCTLYDGDKIIVNPNREEESQGVGSILTVWKNTDQNLVSTVSDGIFSSVQYFKLLEAGRRAANETLAFITLSYDSSCKTRFTQ